MKFTGGSTYYRWREEAGVGRKIPHWWRSDISQWRLKRKGLGRKGLCNYKNVWPDWWGSFHQNCLLEEWACARTPTLLGHWSGSAWEKWGFGTSKAVGQGGSRGAAGNEAATALTSSQTSSAPVPITHFCCGWAGSLLFLYDPKEYVLPQNFYPHWPLVRNTLLSSIKVASSLALFRSLLKFHLLWQFRTTL